MIRLLLAVLLLGLGMPVAAPPSAAAPAASRVAHAVLISLDGMRPDALQRSGGDALAARGSYTWEAQTILPSVTLPGHASMVSGVGPERHNITFNDWSPQMGRIGVATMFDWAQRAGLRAAMLVSKPKLQILARPGAPAQVEVMIWPRGRSDRILPRGAEILATQGPHLLFIHVSDPDVAGHDHGWMSAPYMEAVRRTLAAVTAFLKAVEDAGLAGDTAVIITADHGGHGHSHGSRRPEDMTIPWLALGAGIKQGYRIPRRVTVYDTAPTLLHLLGAGYPRDWDGKPVTEILK